MIALVGNDACWSQISREQIPMFGSNVACQLAVSIYMYSNCSKISRLFEIKCWLSEVEFTMIVKIANRQDPDQTALQKQSGAGSALFVHALYQTTGVGNFRTSTII